MPWPEVTVAHWRALVDKELAGKSFEKTLVQQTPEGIPVQPLYLEAPAGTVRDPSAAPFRICVRLGADATVDELATEVADGADALWLPLDATAHELIASRRLGKASLIFENAALPSDEEVEKLIEQSSAAISAGFSLGLDPIALSASGGALVALVEKALEQLGPLARLVAERGKNSSTVLISTLPFHDAGADGVEELACALSSAARTFRALLEAGLSATGAASQVAVQLAVGRDTFLELCKLRALRTCWGKLLAALGADGSDRLRVHAVCSSRTLTERDPWVNMLRVTTQVFAAVLGGADLVTPNSFDQALGKPSPLGRRVARNTGLVLREESLLGKVADPAGGSYAFETLTDQLARKAWERFRELEQQGGIVVALQSGTLATRLEAAWRDRLAAIGKRKLAILGVSEFANLDEKLPENSAHQAAPKSLGQGLAAHRDAEAFEALRDRAEAAGSAPEALLLTLGGLAESRPRVGFASSFFAAGGIRSRESSEVERAALACVCGADESYASEGAAQVRALKAVGCERVLIAGRPGALENSLRDAGADGFIYVGCDAVATLSGLLGRPS